MDTKFASASVWLRLLIRVFGDNHGKALVGDLLEEYQQRKQTGVCGACIWLLSQYARALSLGLWRLSGTPVGLSCIVSAACLIVLPILVGMLAWLSYMDDTTPQLWNMVLAGEMHKALFVGDYWQAQVDSLSQIDGLWMFLNPYSIIWTMAAMGLVLMTSRKKPHGVRAATMLGIALMLLPYVLGVLYLDIVTLPAQKIGPIIAFTLFNIFYMLPVLALWLHRQVSLRRSVHHA